MQVRRLCMCFGGSVCVCAKERETERESEHAGTKRDEKDTATIRLSVFIRVAPVR